MCCVALTALLGCGPGSGARLERAFAESVGFYRSSKAFACVLEVLEGARPFWEDEGGHGFLVAKLKSSNTEEAITALLQLAVLYDVCGQVWGETAEVSEKLRKRFDLTYYLGREKELLPLAEGDFRKWLEINQECGFGRGRKR